MANALPFPFCWNGLTSALRVMLASLVVIDFPFQKKPFARSRRLLGRYVISPFRATLICRRRSPG
jgi:hypothetical protein